MEFGVSYRYVYKHKNKAYLLWVTRSCSPELVFYRFSNQRVYNESGTSADVPRSGYCLGGVALVPCIGVYLASVYEVQRR
jgi:hypothetical protein